MYCNLSYKTVAALLFHSNLLLLVMFMNVYVYLVCILSALVSGLANYPLRYATPEYSIPTPVSGRLTGPRRKSADSHNLSLCNCGTLRNRDIGVMCAG